MHVYGWLIAGTLSSALLAGCGKKDAPTEAAGAGAMPPPEVEVITVKAHDIPRTLTVPGQLVAVRRAEIRARIEGIVEQQLFREGSAVAAGTPLFRIDPRTLAAAVASAKAEALASHQHLARLRQLIDAKAVSQQELDQAIARQEQAQAALVRAEIDLEHATVTAPISGRIGRAFVTEGALVGRGEPTLLAQIEQLDPIRVDFSLPSHQFQSERTALESGRIDVQLQLPDGQAYGGTGHLLFSELAVDPQTGSVSLRAEFSNPKAYLLPGQPVTVSLAVGQHKNMLTVPQRAVQASPQGQIVMGIGPDNKLLPMPVHVGDLHGSDWIITGGLKGGEQVVINGLQKARPGMPVAPVPAAAKNTSPAGR